MRASAAKALAHAADQLQLALGTLGVLRLGSFLQSSCRVGKSAPWGQSLFWGGTGAFWCWVPAFCRASVLLAPQSDMRDQGKFYFGAVFVAFSLII